MRIWCYMHCVYYPLSLLSGFHRLFNLSTPHGLFRNQESFKFLFLHHSTQPGECELRMCVTY